ncbi:MAG: hypothetical protein NUV77_26755, partial [Thermoguttaceae bacterium]|nr:hypothetical protein [Thermoguttaceae bacterium]
MRRAVLFLSLVSVLLLASCQPAPQAVDDRPLTVTPTADAGPQTVTASPTTDDQRLTTPTPTEA